VGQLDVGGYLARLGLDHPGAPSVEALRRLHRAHVERVPYENLDIQLGRPTTVDPIESAERIVRRRRGGYCYHLNGAFSELLLALGYDVTRHLGGVQRGESDAPSISGAHMALTVRGLADESCPGGIWMLDVGLGSALYEPLPLYEGEHTQGPFSYRLRPSRVEADAWRFDHAVGVGFVGMDFQRRSTGLEAFSPIHEVLSTAPDSPFVRVATAQRRHARGCDILRGLILTRIGPSDRTVTVLEDRGEWFGALADTFGLPLDDVGARDRERLWSRVASAHAAFAASA
jgi:arylamine N-acetyltransferase